MKVPFGPRELEVGGPYLQKELREANALRHNRQALRERFAEDGYLLVRGLHEPRKVEQARRVVAQELARENLLAPGSDALELLRAPGAGGKFWGGRKGITHHPAVQAVLESPVVFDFFGRFFAEPALTFDYKWLRAVGGGENTGGHFDVVYMGRGSERLLTIWTPLGDVPVELGSLAIIPGSHRLEEYARLRQTYGRMDVDRDRVAQGWFSKDPLEIVERFGGTWQTTDFRAGDVLVFGMFTMHASTNNTTDRYRISADTRFQPAADPVDERWAGANPIGHYRWGSDPDKVVSMEKARAEWGL